MISERHNKAGNTAAARAKLPPSSGKNKHRGTILPGSICKAIGIRQILNQDQACDAKAIKAACNLSRVCTARVHKWQLAREIE
jgi:hypothetical protein